MFIEDIMLIYDKAQREKHIKKDIEYLNLIEQFRNDPKIKEKIVKAVKCGDELCDFRFSDASTWLGHSRCYAELEYKTLNKVLNDWGFSTVFKPDEKYGHTTLHISFEMTKRKLKEDLK